MILLIFHDILHYYLIVYSIIFNFHSFLLLMSWLTNIYSILWTNYNLFLFYYIMIL